MIEREHVPLFTAKELKTKFPKIVEKLQNVFAKEKLIYNNEDAQKCYDNFTRIIYADSTPAKNRVFGMTQGDLCRLIGLTPIELREKSKAYLILGYELFDEAKYGAKDTPYKHNYKDLIYGQYLSAIEQALDEINEAILNENKFSTNERENKMEITKRHIKTARLSFCPYGEADVKRALSELALAGRMPGLFNGICNMFAERWDATLEGIDCNQAVFEYLRESVFFELRISKYDFAEWEEDFEVYANDSSTSFDVSSGGLSRLQKHLDGLEGFDITKIEPATAWFFDKIKFTYKEKTK